MHLRTAVIQLNSRNNPAENLATVEHFLDRAAAMGAQFASLPEFWTYLGPYAGFDEAAQTIPGPTIERLQEKARKHKMIVHGGSIVERVSTMPGKFHNTSVLIDRAGEIIAQYRKIHLFDVDLANGEKHYESERIVPGNEIVTAEVDGVTFGLTVCYDLRFPELYRSYRDLALIVVPSAFTAVTGAAHWHVLLKARAIENQCYVLAAAQGGTHDNGRRTYGHSVLIDPWGTVVAERAEGPGVIVGDIDASRLAQVRRDLPALSHRRLGRTSR